MHVFNNLDQFFYDDYIIDILPKPIKSYHLIHPFEHKLY